MKICPSCGYEYRDEISVCPECQVPLSDGDAIESISQPIPPMPAQEGWTELEGIIPPLSAEMAKDLLEQNGIPCLLQSRRTEGYLLRDLALGDKIVVPISKLEEAKEIMDAFTSKTEAQVKMRPCPHCGEMIEDYRIMCPKCEEPTGWD